jgi:hypothetical protein
MGAIIMFFPTTTSGTGGDILRLLKDYKHKLPVTFLRDTLGEDADEIDESLEDLEKRGVIRRQGDSVELASE